jgi:hypothetical protein
MLVDMGGSELGEMGGNLTETKVRGKRGMIG